MRVCRYLVHARAHCRRVHVIICARAREAVAVGFWRRFPSSLHFRHGSVFRAWVVIEFAVPRCYVSAQRCVTEHLAGGAGGWMHGQIVGMINNLNVPFPAGVSDYINIAAITQLNLEIMQHSCVLGDAEDACARRAQARAQRTTRARQVLRQSPHVLLAPGPPRGRPRPGVRRSASALAARNVGVSTVVVDRGRSLPAFPRPVVQRRLLCLQPTVCPHRDLATLHPICSSQPTRLQLRADDLGELVPVQLQAARRWDEPADARASSELLRRRMGRRARLRHLDARAVGHTRSARARRSSFSESMLWCKARWSS